MEDYEAFWHVEPKPRPPTRMILALVIAALLLLSYVIL